ncbi:MAG: hypothetical protein KGJ42_01855 [Acidobacteriota bacterium]|nr:hypothetical protein [Acidobacteriota bacterium]
MKRRLWVLLPLSLVGALVSSLAVAATLSWTNAKIVTLPVGGTGFYQGQFSTLACARGGNCVASGPYLTQNGVVHTVTVSEINGAWRGAAVLGSPTNAETNAGLSVYGASCPEPGSCALVGNYQTAAGNVVPFAASSSANHWSTPVAIALPSDAPASESNALLRAVACASAGNCDAVGTYLDGAAAPHTLALAAREVSGTWQRATSLTLPSDANVNSLVSLTQLSCSSAGNCVATGSYVNHDNVTQALVVNEINGTWQHGQALALPGNASAYAGAALSGLTCTSAGNCVSVGVYNTVAGTVEGLVVNEVNGTWQRGRELVAPVDAAANPQIFFYGFSEVSCASAGNCAVGGQYRDQRGDYQGLLVNEVNGTWQRASSVALPAGATQAGKNGGVVAVTCPVKGSCRAGAAYLDANGNYQAMTVTQTNGTWLRGTRVTLPAGATNVGVAGGLYGLVCTTSTTCSAIGSYLDQATNYQGFTLTAP